MEDKGIKLTFPALFRETVKRFGKRDALAFAGEEPMSYDSVNRTIVSVMARLGRHGITVGDRVAILGNNMPNWGITYYAVTFMGAVAVPVLPDFSNTEVANVLEHSEAKAIVISGNLQGKIDEIRSEHLRTAILMDDFSVIFSGAESPSQFDPNGVPDSIYEPDEEDLASIIYTSGTTGRSKGVMLTHKNICFNALKGKKIQPLDENDKFLSVLPLSHTYENTLGLILPMLCGSCVYYLRKPPTPAVLLPALQEIRPSVMLTVPLIIEKIYFNRILPAFNGKPVIRLLYRIPAVRKKLNAVAGKKLMVTFGGNLRFFGIGGAKLNRTVEKFLLEAKFPYAIGYGLTETAPLLAGANPQRSVFESTGPAVEGVDLRINDPDPRTGEGEIWARGANVMKGYYKEPELTARVLTPDGWFKTGDLGLLDSSGNLYIKGRLKNMIVGASGENIYPEEIESVINSFRYVVESLVIQQKGRLVALVHLNMEELERKYLHLKQEVQERYDEKKHEIREMMDDKRQDLQDRFEEKKEQLLSELKEYVNSHVNKFSRIHSVILQPLPFQKTATMKIKRFLYA